MAKNLLDTGHEIIVHDVFPEAVVDLKSLGAATASTPSEVASEVSTIVTMLPSRYFIDFQDLLFYKENLTKLNVLTFLILNSEKLISAC